MGQAVHWNVRAAIRRAIASHNERPEIQERLAGTTYTFKSYVIPFTALMLWSQVQQIEHATAARFAGLVGAQVSAFKLEWLECGGTSTIDWKAEFQQAVTETLDFCGLSKAIAGPVEEV